MSDIDQLERITDPAECARQVGKRLADIPQFQEHLRKIRQQAVLKMRAAGMSYAAIAAEIGLHRNRVQQIAEGRPGGGKGTKSEQES